MSGILTKFRTLDYLLYNDIDVGYGLSYNILIIALKYFKLMFMIEKHISITLRATQIFMRAK